MPHNKQMTKKQAKRDKLTHPRRQTSGSRTFPTFPSRPVTGNRTNVGPGAKGLSKRPAKNAGVRGNTRARSVIGLHDLRRAVKRRDKKTVTRAEAKSEFVKQAQAALSAKDRPEKLFLGRRLAKKGLGLHGAMKKRKRRKAGLGTATGKAS